MYMLVFMENPFRIRSESVDDLLGDKKLNGQLPWNGQSGCAVSPTRISGLSADMVFMVHIDGIFWEHRMNPYIHNTSSLANSRCDSHFYTTHIDQPAKISPFPSVLNTSQQANLFLILDLLIFWGPSWILIDPIWHVGLKLILKPIRSPIYLQKMVPQNSNSGVAGKFWADFALGKIGKSRNRRTQQVFATEDDMVSAGGVFSSAAPGPGWGFILRKPWFFLGEISISFLGPSMVGLWKKKPLGWDVMRWIRHFIEVFYWFFNWLVVWNMCFFHI